MKDISLDKLIVSNLSAKYYSNTVLENVSFSVPTGKLIGIIGPNGAGKSTLLKAILGLINSSYSSITFKDKDIKTIKKDIAYVKQRADYDLNFPIQVIDLVLLGVYPKLSLFKQPNKNHKEKALQALKQLDMDLFYKKQISELSGGQLQRVFLARVLVQDADLIFLDEPFTGIDAYSEEKIIHILKKERDKGKTIIMVYHDLSKVKEYFNHIILVNKNVIANGETESTFTKENLRETYKSSLLDIL